MGQPDANVRGPAGYGFPNSRLSQGLLHGCVRRPIYFGCYQPVHFTLLNLSAMRLPVPHLAPAAQPHSAAGLRSSSHGTCQRRPGALSPYGHSGSDGGGGGGGAYQLLCPETSGILLWPLDPFQSLK